MDNKLYNKVKELFPDAPEDFVKAIYYNIDGKSLLWKLHDEMNDDSKRVVKDFDL